MHTDSGTMVVLCALWDLAPDWLISPHLLLYEHSTHEVILTGYVCSHVCICMSIL